MKPKQVLFKQNINAAPSGKKQSCLNANLTITLNFVAKKRSFHFILKLNKKNNEMSRWINALGSEESGFKDVFSGLALLLSLSQNFIKTASHAFD